MRVKEIMTPRVEVASPTSTLHEAAAKMKACDIGALPICDQDQLVGMVTDRDITVRATAEGENPDTIRVRDIMTPNVVCCFEDQLVADAARLMQENQVRRLVVLDHDRHPVGMISLGDVAVESGDDELVGQTVEQVCAGIMTMEEHQPGATATG